MAGYVVDPRDDLFITLNSHAVEGTLENVKSDFTINMAQPIQLSRGTWYCLLNCMTFSSKIINYNGSYENSGPEGGRGVTAGDVDEEEDEETPILPVAKMRRMLPPADNSKTVECSYDVLAVDGDGDWRKVTPGERGKPMTISFTDVTDIAAVANDINLAITSHVERIAYPPYPNPTTTTVDKGTYLQFYRNLSAEGDPPVYRKRGYPLQLEPVLNRCKDTATFFYYITEHGRLRNDSGTYLRLHDNGRLNFYTEHRIGFFVYGNDPASRKRMMRVFGQDENTISFDTGCTGNWQSPFVASEEKPEHGTPIDPYNLSAPYTWWGPSAASWVSADGNLGDFLNEDGKEFVHIEYKMGSMKRPLKADVLYEDIFNSPSADHALDLILHRSIQHRIDERGYVHLNNKRDTTCNITFTGMPCDVIPNLLGLYPYPPYGYWHTNEGKHRVELRAVVDGVHHDTWMRMLVRSSFTPRKTVNLSHLVHAVAKSDPERIEFRKKDNGVVQHAHGFSMAFPEDSPFYPFAKVTVGEVGGDGAFVPPKGYTSPMVVPKEMAVWVKGRMRGSDEADDSYNDTHIDPASILPFEPYKLKGLIPHGPDQELMLKKGWKRKVPESGYRARIAAKRVVPTEEWSGVWAKTQAYAFNDVVGDLPFPASYQTPESLIAALYTSMNHAISDDPDNAQHEVNAEELLKVTYDKSTCKYIFECGPKAARVRLSMQRSMAELFGVAPDDYDDGDGSDAAPFVTVSFASARMYEVKPATKEDMDWARVGHATVKKPWMADEANPNDDGPTMPVAVRSAYPVTPSLGTENMYIKCDLIGSSVIHDGTRDSVLATVPVNWAEESSSVHQPIWEQPIPVNTETIRAINIKVHDSNGERIKFMSNDNTPVIFNLRLTKRRNG